MSSQLRFYYQAEIERALVTELSALAFFAWRSNTLHPELLPNPERITRSSARQVAFTPSPPKAPAHATGAFIQLSRPQPPALDACIWCDSVASQPTDRAFERLRRYFRRHGT